MLKKKLLPVIILVFIMLNALCAGPARVYAGSRVVIRDCINYPAANIVQVPMILGKNCDRIIAAKTTVQLNRIPPSVIKSFCESGWSLKMITVEEMQALWKKRTKKSIPKGYYIGGLTSYDKAGNLKEINVCDQDNTPQRAIIHEFGHFVDVMNGLPSDNSRQFMKIFSKEKYTYVDSDGSEDYCNINGDIHEYFASIYDEYVKNPDNLMATAPESYSFIDRCVKEIPVGTEKQTFWY